MLSYTPVVPLILTDPTQLLIGQVISSQQSLIGRSVSAGSWMAWCEWSMSSICIMSEDPVSIIAQGELTAASACPMKVIVRIITITYLYFVSFTVPLDTSNDSIAEVQSITWGRQFNLPDAAIRFSKSVTHKHSYPHVLSKKCCWCQSWEAQRFSAQLRKAKPLAG